MQYRGPTDLEKYRSRQRVLLFGVQLPWLFCWRGSSLMTIFSLDSPCQLFDIETLQRTGQVDGSERVCALSREDVSGENDEPTHGKRRVNANHDSRDPLLEDVRGK